jgi:hypothetical protein
MEMVLAILNDGEKPESIMSRPDITWYGVNENNNSSFRESCTKLLRSEYIWRNE